MLSWSLDQDEGPVAIRVPVAGVESRPDFARPEGGYARGWEVAREGADVALLALGDAFPLGRRVVDELGRAGVSATLVNPRRAGEPNEGLLKGLTEKHRVIVTLEDGILEGGFGERCARVLAADDVRVLCYGLPSAFVDRYDPEELLAACGMTPEGVTADALRALRA